LSSRAGEGDSLSLVAEGSGLFLRIVCDLRRVCSHIATLAYPVFNRMPRSASAPLLNHDNVKGRM
jgi:hypothetical protein